MKDDFQYHYLCYFSQYTHLQEVTREETLCFCTDFCSGDHKPKQTTHNYCKYKLIENLWKEIEILSFRYFNLINPIWHVNVTTNPLLTKIISCTACKLLCERIISKALDRIIVSKEMWKYLVSTTNSKWGGGKVCIRAKWSIKLGLITVSVAWSY